MPSKLWHSFILLLLVPLPVSADQVVLKSGAKVTGAVESGNARELSVRTGGRLQIIPIEKIQSIHFDASPPAAPAAVEAPPPALPRAVPAGAPIVVRTIDRIESKKADKNREYRAALDEPLAIGGFTVAPVNTLAMLQVTGVKNAKVKGRSTLTLQVVALMVDGKRVPVQTEDVSSESGSQGKRTAEGTAAGAGVGAGIGGLAGGAAGAAAGAAVGAATGAAGAVRFGQTVKVPPETRFTFILTREAALP